MAGLLAGTLEGLGEQLASINASVDAANRERNKNMITEIIRLTEAAPVLIEKFGEGAEPIVKLIVESLLAGVFRLGSEEVVIRGNIERNYSWGAEAKGHIGTSWAGLEASGFYTQSGGENHGVEIRLGYIGGAVDSKVVAAFVERWQARGAPDPQALDILEEVMPLIEKLLGTTPDPDA